MSKETLNLSIDENIKQLAKRLAKKRGINVSRLFEELISRQNDPEEYSPAPGSAAERIYNFIPESRKTDHYDFKKLKEQALKDKYGL